MGDEARSKSKKHSKCDFDLIKTIHAAEHDVDAQSKPAHSFIVTLEEDKCTPEKFELYKSYQVAVHHDEPSKVSMSGFQRFLCESPLQRSTSPDGKRFGSYHQCYRLDGRLIAMGVLDLLPHAVSSVYLVYDQEFAEWSFGKLSAMREACLALEQGYEFYYMGYYIHECQKMRYKGDYRPQLVLDSMTYEWQELADQVKSIYGADQQPRRQQDWQYAQAREAAESGRSLLKFGMPGVVNIDSFTNTDFIAQIIVHAGQSRFGRVSVCLNSCSNVHD